MEIIENRGNDAVGFCLQGCNIVSNHAMLAIIEDTLSLFDLGQLVFRLS
jgi:hypothetical protein